MNNKLKTLARGSLLRMGSFFITAIIAFAMMPFIVRCLGDKNYGLWIFIATFLNFYGIFDLGFGQAVERYLSRAIGSQDHEEANIVINTSLWIFSIIGVVTLFLAVGTTFLVPLFVRNISEVALFKQIVVILGLSFAFSFPMKVFSAILVSHLRYDLVTTIDIAKLLLKTVLTIIFLKLGYGILALAFITLMTDLISYLAGYIVVQKTVTSVMLARKFINLSRIKTLFQYGVYAFVNRFADKLCFGIDNFVIAMFLGLSPVTLYTVALRLVDSYISLINNAVSILIPVFSQYESRGDYDSIREKFILATKVSSYFSILIGGVILIFGRMFIVRWMGQAYEGAYILLVVLAVPVMITLMQCPSVEVVYGVSKHKFYTISNSVGALANLVLSVILVKKIGLIGVALGTAIPMLVIKLFIQPVYTCRVIGLSIRYYYGELFFAILLKSGLVLGVLWLVMKSFILPSYFRLFCQMAMSMGLFALIAFFIGFTRSERGYFLRAIGTANHAA